MPRVKAHRVKGHMRRIKKRGRDKIVRIKGHMVKSHSRRKARR